MKNLAHRSLVAVVVLTLGACGGKAPPPASGASANASEAPAKTAAIAAEPKPMFDLQMAALKAYVAAFNKHDAKAIAALYAPTASFVERGRPGNSGRDAIIADFQNYFDAYPDVSTTITRSWHWGDAALFEYVEGGTQSGQRIILPPPPQTFDPLSDGKDDHKAPERRSETPTGKKFGYVGASILRFTPEGLVRLDTTYCDELTREVQSGWAPPSLAKMPVRPVVAVPAATDTWETHKVASDADAKAPAAKASLYNRFALRSEKDFLAGLTDDVVLSAFDDPKDAKGKKEAGALFKDWTSTFADGVVDATESWSVDGYVVMIGVFTGKHVGAWGTIKPKKNTFKTHFLDIVKLGKDDKIERLWSYANNYELLQYLDYGASAPAATPAKKP